jgi:hypothetical protein
MASKLVNCSRCGQLNVRVMPDDKEPPATCRGCLELEAEEKKEGKAPKATKTR